MEETQSLANPGNPSGQDEVSPLNRVLTMDEKSWLTKAFLQRKLLEFEVLQDEIESLQRQAEEA